MPASANTSDSPTDPPFGAGPFCVQQGLHVPRALGRISFLSQQWEVMMGERNKTGEELDGEKRKGAPPAYDGPQGLLDAEEEYKAMRREEHASE